jgi:hypothetical protein
VAAIDVAAIRDQRMGTAAGPMPRMPNRANANANGYGNGSQGQAGAAQPYGQPDAQPAPASNDDDEPKSKPIYKQWWFWVVVGVSGLILIDFATSDSSATTNLVIDPQLQSTAPAAGGLEWRF